MLPKVEEGFTDSMSMEGSGSSGRLPDGLGVTLTFDQQRQHRQALELERLRLDVQLREADLTQQQHELECYRLDLIKEGNVIIGFVLRHYVFIFCILLNNLCS